MSKNNAKELLEFIAQCKSCYHAAANVVHILKENGYIQLQERDKWQLKTGGRYFVTRNGSAVIAFSIPEGGVKHFQIMASHSDAPSFKLKEHPEMLAEQKYVKLNVEKYGGMLMAQWFDRPLSLAGRLLIKEDNGISTRLVDVDRDLLMIPSLAIHMDRNANEGHALNPQVELLPLYGGADTKGSLRRLLSESAQTEPEKVMGMDVFLYNRMKGIIWGAEEEFLSSGRLDDLQCAFCSLQGFLTSGAKEHTPVYCMMDNEEVGSLTRQGAASTFLKDTLMRICMNMGMVQEDYLRHIAGSFMVSADNAHSFHPNYPEKSDPVNRPYINGGVVVKHSANQKYTTDAVSAAVFKMICDKAKVPYQDFHNRSDMVGGSTLGNISTGQVPLRTVDVGLAQLAMHSSYETAGVKDTDYLVQASKVFYNSDIILAQDEKYFIQ